MWLKNVKLVLQEWGRSNIVLLREAPLDTGEKG